MSTKKMVMIPGPTPVVESIRQEMGREIQAFGDPRFVADYKKLIADLGALLNCSGMTFPLAGTGTLAMEMAIANTTKRVPTINLCFFYNIYCCHLLVTPYPKSTFLLFHSKHTLFRK